MTNRRRLWLHLLLAALLTTAASASLVAAPASAAVPGYVRWAHLSPDAPPMDLSVTSFRGREHSKTFAAVAYGALSDYQRLAPGSYTVAMAAPEGGQVPMVRASLRVKAGQAYTVAGVGRHDDFNLLVISDDFAKPRAGKAAIRVVNASSAAAVDVATTPGVPLAEGLRFPSVTPYAEIAAQKVTLRADANDGSVEPGEKTVAVKPGTSYTALVLDRGISDSGAPALRVIVSADAAASVSTPVGSVDAGRLGGAGAADGRGLPRDVLLAGALALVGAAALWARRRART